jgi:hypothetical protein
MSHVSPSESTSNSAESTSNYENLIFERSCDQQFGVFDKSAPSCPGPAEYGSDPVAEDQGDYQRQPDSSQENDTEIIIECAEKCWSGCEKSIRRRIDAKSSEDGSVCFGMWELVWAKLKSASPWWPGQISAVPPRFRSHLRLRPDEHCVFWYGTRTYSRVPRDLLAKFEPHRDDFSRRCSTPQFRRAMRDISDFAAGRWGGAAEALAAHTVARPSTAAAAHDDGATAVVPEGGGGGVDASAGVGAAGPPRRRCGFGLCEQCHTLHHWRTDCATALDDATSVGELPPPPTTLERWAAQYGPRGAPAGRRPAAHATERRPRRRPGEGAGPAPDSRVTGSVAVLLLRALPIRVTVRGRNRVNLSYCCCYYFEKYILL